MTDNAFSFVAGGVGSMAVVLLGLMLMGGTLLEVVGFGLACLVFVGFGLSAWERRTSQ